MGVNRLINFGMPRQALILSLIRLLDGLVTGILLVSIPLYTAELFPTFIRLPEPILIGLGVSVYSMMNSILQPSLGTLSDRTGRRKPFIVSGYVIIGVCCLAYIFNDHYETFLLLRILQGAGISLVFAAAFSQMVVTTKQPYRGRALGAHQALRRIGLTLGPMLGGSFYVLFGLDAALLTCVGLMLIAFLLAQWLLEDLPTDSHHKQVESRTFRQAGSPEMGFYALGASLMIVGASFAMVAVLESEFSIRLQMTVIGFGMAFTSSSLSQLIFQVPAGFVSDRIGHKKIIMLGLVMLGLTTLLMGIVHTSTFFLVLRFCQGIASAGIIVPALAMAANLSRSGQEGNQMGIVSMGYGIGSSLGPLLTSMLIFVSFEFSFLVIAILILLCTWVIYRYVPKDSDIARSSIE